MEGHVNTPSEVLQSPKDMCRKRPAPEGSRSLSATAPNGSLAVETSEKKISYSSFRHDKGDVEMHSPYNKMPSHISTCFSKPECAELPRKLARAFGHTAHQPGTRKHQRDALGPCRVCPQHSRPMTEAYRALRLQVPTPAGDRSRPCMMHVVAQAPEHVQVTKGTSACLSVNISV